MIAPLDRRRERWVQLLLTAVQFTHVLDFMILMPLGPQLMRAFGITASQFGALVSAYNFSAGAAGLLATFVLDRWDRKRALLLLYGGFALATLSCALAPSYPALLGARVLAGAFGGVAASQVLALVGDLVPTERRGAAFGLVMSGFSLAAVAGVPAGLWLAQLVDWHTPFSTLSAIALVLGLIMTRILPSVPPHPEPGGVRAVVERARQIAIHPNHLRAFALTLVLAFAAFLVFPYLSPSLVANAGFPERHLPLVYIVGGAVTIFATNLVGRLSDRFGRLRIYRIGAVASMVPVMLVTHLPVLPMALTLVCTALFMSLNSTRIVPATAMITASVIPRQRGGFMSLNSALQQLGGGLAVSVAAWIVDQDAAGHILHYGTIGWLSVGLIGITLVLAGRLRVAEAESRP